jgi:hypothetical protein
MTARPVRWLAIALAVWAAVAYLILPTFWRHYEHLPAMVTMPTITHAPSGLPADPLNVALVGSEAQIIHALDGARWYPADPITLGTALRIAESVVLHRPDPNAPVSTLILFGRRQDLAFEQDVGGSAKERNHVRFWRTDVRSRDDAPVWIGAATFDRGVGLSHDTGQITHHISADIDAERDTLMHDLEAAGWVTERFFVTGVGPTLDGHNGGGDRYYTDGEIAVGVLASTGEVGRRAVVLASPTPIVVKQQFWSWIRPWLAN